MDDEGEPTRALAGRVVLTPGEIAFALGVFHGAVGAAAFIPAPHPGGDNATYVALARSLVERHAYLSIWAPGAPPHTRFPPLFPAMLAVLQVLGVSSWVRLKGVVLITSAGFVAVSFLWMRRRIGQTAALALGIYLAVAPGLLDASHWILSDIPFGLLVVAALLCFERAEWSRSEPPTETTRRTRSDFVFGLVFTLLAALTRTAALPLLIAMAMLLVARRDFRRLGMFALVVIVPLGVWAVRNAVAGGGNYGAEFLAVNPYVPGAGTVDLASMLQRVATNASSYVNRHLPDLLFGRGGGYAAVGATAVVTLALIGYVARLRRPGIPELFFAGYTSLVLLWSSIGATERFLVPALPLVLAYCSSGVAVLARWAGRHARAATPLLAVLLILGAAPATTRMVRFGTRCTRLYRQGRGEACEAREVTAFREVALWAKAHLSKDAVVASRKPTIFFAESSLRSVIYPLSPVPDSFFAFVRQDSVGYIVVDRIGELTAGYVGPAIIGDPGAFCVLYVAARDRSTALLRIDAPQRHVSAAGQPFHRVSVPACR